MSTEKNTYSIAALAAELQVPRTTVNDWLSRYADFMDSELSGRRRLYTARTLSVLREIAALRDQGSSGAEIEDLLARRHGVRPDVAAAEAAPERPAPEAPTEAPTAAPTAAASEKTAPEGGETGENSFPVALRRFDENFQAFGRWMQEQQALQEAQKRRQRLTAALVLVLLAVLLAAVGAGAWALDRSETRRRAEQEMLAAALQRQRELGDHLGAKIAQLEASAEQERRAAAQAAAEAARRAAAEKAELLANHRRAMTEMRAAWTAERAKQEQYWAELQDRQSTANRELVARWEQSLREMERARTEEKRLQEELEAARRALRDAEAKLRAGENIPPAPPEVPAAMPAETPAKEPAR